MAKGDEAARLVSGDEVNRLCAGCVRGCKQGTACVVVSCPRHVPVCGAAKGAM